MMMKIQELTFYMATSFGELNREASHAVVIVPSAR
jgi:hypothetical protein